MLTGIVTILSMVTFLGIVWWAWSKHRVKDNEQAANLPFDLPDEGDSNNQTDSGDKKP